MTIRTRPQEEAVLKHRLKHRRQLINKIIHYSVYVEIDDGFEMPEGRIASCVSCDLTYKASKYEGADIPGAMTLSVL